MTEFSNKVSKEFQVTVVFDPEEWVLKMEVRNKDGFPQTFKARMGQRISIDYTVDVHFNDIKTIKQLERSFLVKMGQ